MKYAILLFIVAYFVWGIRIAVLSFKETMAGIPNIARSGTYKLGAQIGAYFSFPFTILIWPLWYVPNSWVGGVDE